MTCERSGATILSAAQLTVVVCLPFQVKDLWTGATSTVDATVEAGLSVTGIPSHGVRVFKVSKPEAQ
jgi:hypothetical protein